MQYLSNLSQYNIYEKHKFNIPSKSKKYLRLKCAMNMIAVEFLGNNSAAFILTWLDFFQVFYNLQ